MAHQLGQWGNLDLQGVLDGPDAGESVGVGADPAGTLREQGCVFGRTPLENYLESAEQLAADPCVFYLVVFQGDLYFEMAFYSCHRVHDQPLAGAAGSILTHAEYPPLRMARVSFFSDRLRWDGKRANIHPRTLVRCTRCRALRP